MSRNDLLTWVGCILSKTYTLLIGSSANRLVSSVFLIRYVITVSLGTRGVQFTTVELQELMALSGRSHLTVCAPLRTAQLFSIRFLCCKEMMHAIFLYQ